MARDTFTTFLTKEWRGLLLAFSIVLGLAILSVVIGERIGLSIGYSDFGSIVLATVALASLFIAWRELSRKTQPNTTIFFDFDRREDGTQVANLKLTNSGANVLTPINVWYGAVWKTDLGEYFFTNTRHTAFQADGLQPGETAVEELGENLAMLQLKTVNIRDWKGEGVTLEDFNAYEYPVKTEQMDQDIQVEIQRIFKAVMRIETQFGRPLTPDEIRQGEVGDAIKEHLKKPLD